MHYVLIHDADAMIAWGATAGDVEEDDSASGVATLLPRALAIGTSMERANFSVGPDVSMVQLTHVDDSEPVNEFETPTCSSLVS